MDKGWAWVVLVACFVDFFLSGWFVYTVGVVHVALLEAYNDDVAKTSWVGALHSSMMCLTGPLAGAVINRYDCRVCTVLGGVLILIGFSVSAYVRGINILMFTYGLVAGAGTGFCYCPAVVALGYNFKKYLGITAGVSMTGAALGIFSGSPITRYLLDNYGLSGTYLLMGGIGANLCACGMLMRPSKLERDRKRQRQEEKKIKLSLRESVQQAYHGYTESLRNKAFVCHLSSILTWNIGMSAIYLHLPFYAESKGTSPEAAAALFTGMGACSMAARLLTGLVVTTQAIDGIILHMGSLGMTAIVTLLFPLYSATYVGQMTFSSLLGFYFATPMILLSSLTVELVGVDQLASAFGIETFVLGSGYLVGPPIAGAIVDSGLSYDFSFIMAGGFLLLSSVVTLGTAAFHGESHLPVEPSIFNSLTVIPIEAASALSLRAKELQDSAHAPRNHVDKSEKADVIHDLETLLDVLDTDGCEVAENERSAMLKNFEVKPEVICEPRFEQNSLTQVTYKPGESLVDEYNKCTPVVPKFDDGACATHSRDSDMLKSHDPHMQMSCASTASEALPKMDDVDFHRSDILVQ